MIRVDCRVNHTQRYVVVFISIWTLVNWVPSQGETVEIVTPQNSRASTTTTTTEKSTRAVVKKPQVPEWASNDSYVRAYKEVHGLGAAKRSDYYEGTQETQQDQPYDTVIRSTYLPQDKYPSLTHQQWVPSGPPSPPPHYHYGPPHHNDLPTRPWPSMPYSSPSNSFLSFLPKKLSLKLIFKILLKLVLFKMVVKFIAILCLLLFIPTLKTKVSGSGGDDSDDSDERRKARQLDFVSNFIWDSLAEKDADYADDDEDTKSIREIAEEADKEPSSSGPESAVRFLQFCISTVDRVVGFMLSYLKRQRNEEDDLSAFILDRFNGLVQRL